MHECEQNSSLFTYTLMHYCPICRTTPKISAKSDKPDGDSTSVYADAESARCLLLSARGHASGSFRAPRGAPRTYGCDVPDAPAWLNHHPHRFCLGQARRETL